MMTRRRFGDGGGRGVWRRSLVTAILAAALVFFPSTSARANPEFKKIGQTATGQAFTSTFPATSASQAFRAAFATLAHACDARPTLQSAVRNASGDAVQGFFRGSMHGTAIRGVITTSARGGTAAAAVILERADAFPKSLAALSRHVAAAQPAAAPAAGAPTGSARAAAPLTFTRLPDGGAIGLAPGWRVTSNQDGGVAATNGSSTLSLGSTYPILVRPYGRPDPRVLSGPYRSPWPALLMLIDQSTHGGVRNGSTKVERVGQTPVTNMSGEAAKITVDVTSRSGTIRALFLVNTTRMGNEQWQLYVSSVQAPASKYAEELPTLDAMWGSWALSPQVVQSRIDATNRANHETAELHRQGQAYQARASEIGAIATDQYIRDVQTIQNLSTGRAGDFDNHYAEALVAALNRNGGSYRIVPPSELAP